MTTTMEVACFSSIARQMARGDSLLGRMPQEPKFLIVKIVTVARMGKGSPTIVKMVVTVRATDMKSDGAMGTQERASSKDPGIGTLFQVNKT